MRGGGPASFSGDTRAGPPPSTHQEREALCTGITPRDKRVHHRFLIPCALPRPRLAAGQACPPHRFRLAASRTLTTRAQGQGLTPPRTSRGDGIAAQRLRAWLQLVVAGTTTSPDHGRKPGGFPELADTRARLHLPVLHTPAPAHRGPATPKLRPRRRRSGHQPQGGALPGCDPTPCSCSQRRIAAQESNELGGAPAPGVEGKGVNVGHDHLNDIQRGAAGVGAAHGMRVR